MLHKVQFTTDALQHLQGQKYSSNPYNLPLTTESCRDNSGVAADQKNCSSHASFFPGANFPRQQ